MRIKLVAVYLLVFLLFAGLMVWRADNLMFADKLTWSEAQSRAQISALVHSLESESQLFLNVAEQTSKHLGDSDRDFAKGEVFEQFLFFAKLTPPSAPGQEWILKNKFNVEPSKIKSWSASYSLLAMKNIAPETVKPGELSLFTLLDPNRNIYLLWVFHFPKNNWALAITDSRVLQKLIDSQKGQMSTLAIINDLGQTLGHSTPEYIGNLLTEDPMIADMLKSKNPSGSGLFKDLNSQQIQSFYEKNPIGNFYIVVMTSVKQLLAERTGLQVQFVLLSLGFLLIGLSSIFFLTKDSDEESALQMMPKAQVFNPKLNAAKPSAGATPGSTPIAPKSEAASETKLQNFMSLSSTLVHEFRAPLNSVLAHTQILKAKDRSENLEIIEKETRNMRDIMQKLLVFSGETEVRRGPVKVEALIQRALNQIQPKFAQKNIKLIKNFLPTVDITSSDDLLFKVFVHILNNAVEAMDRVAKKELFIGLKSNSEWVEIEFKDTGEGIEPKNLEKIYDPFYTTKSSQQHSGLGLSSSLGIMRELRGQLTVQSEIGKGSSVKVYIPLKVTEEVYGSVDNKKSASNSVMSEPQAPRTPPPSQRKEFVINKEDLKLESVTDDTVPRLKKFLVKDGQENFPPSPANPGIDVPEIEKSKPAFFMASAPEGKSTIDSGTQAFVLVDDEVDAALDSLDKISEEASESEEPKPKKKVQPESAETADDEEGILKLEAPVATKPSAMAVHSPAKAVRLEKPKINLNRKSETDELSITIRKPGSKV